MNSSSDDMPSESRNGHEQVFDVVVVGAGFAGMYMLHRLRRLGLSACVLEAGGGVGGTWYWNRYPGARCDIESMEYSYQFSDALQQEWVWSERYAAQPEILSYAEHVADRFDLLRDIRFNTRVSGATFDEETERWKVRTEDGQRIVGRYFVMATGCLSSANTPRFAGQDEFGGDTYHTGQWPHEGVDFTGKRVAVVGTGSSGVQSIPLIAAQAEHLFVFQRTPSYTVPAHNGPLTPEVQDEIKANYQDLRDRARRNRGGHQYEPRDLSALEASPEEREAEMQFRWDRGGLSFSGSFRDLLLDKDANAIAAEFVHRKIREVVKNSEVADRLCPTSLLGCKRMCIDTGYYETYNRDNVTLVDIKACPISRLTATGIETNEETYAVDAIVFATGFDAMTGALLKPDIRGRSGKTLKEKWREGPRTYLGVATAEFPNMFTVTGPGSPSVLTNMLPSIEQHVEWISDLIGEAEKRGVACVEATREAELEWSSHVNAVAAETLFPSCNSWYLGANIPGKPRVFMPYIGFPEYVEKCDQIAATGYKGFDLREARSA